MVEDEMRVPPNALVPYLARHGVKATIHVLQPESRTTGEALLDSASRFGADLLVMGAYGHSRVREWILGGATQKNLTEATLPVLMMH
jgi:nucleotide-binding universal stress UspA family protein